MTWYRHFPAVLNKEALVNMEKQRKLHFVGNAEILQPVPPHLSIYQYLTSDLFGDTPEEIKAFLRDAAIEDGWTEKGLRWARWVGDRVFWVDGKPYLIANSYNSIPPSPPPRTKIETIVRKKRNKIAPPSPKEVSDLIHALEYTQDRAAITYLVSAVDSWGRVHD